MTTRPLSSEDCFADRPRSASRDPIALVFPVYGNSPRLKELLSVLVCKSGGSYPLILVDDGTEPPLNNDLLPDSSSAHCILLRHARNQGKGAALKSAFRYYLAHWPNGAGVVCADSDGQHLPDDILRVAARLEELSAGTDLGAGADSEAALPESRTEESFLILGVRNFHHAPLHPSTGSHSEKKQGQPPWKSRLGNRLSALCFRLFSGISLTDTQTGLRGIPRSDLKHYLKLPGTRFEFETEMLLSFVKRSQMAEKKRSKDGKIEEIPIQTVYLNGNRNSHFRALSDSFLILKSLSTQR